jgi:hypothetical protein
MRITKQSLTRRCCHHRSGALVFAILAWSDFRLKSRRAFGTADLQGFATPQDIARPFWSGRRAMRCGPASIGAWIIS